MKGTTMLFIKREIRIATIITAIAIPVFTFLLTVHYGGPAYSHLFWQDALGVAIVFCWLPYAAAIPLRVIYWAFKTEG